MNVNSTNLKAIADVVSKANNVNKKAPEVKPSEAKVTSSDAGMKTHEKKAETLEVKDLNNEHLDVAFNKELISCKQLSVKNLARMSLENSLVMSSYR